MRTRDRKVGQSIYLDEETRASIKAASKVLRDRNRFQGRSSSVITRYLSFQSLKIVFRSSTSATLRNTSKYVSTARVIASG
jgi:hypothetical protein